MNDRVIVHEVGLRDGLQLHPDFVPTDDKLRLIDALLAAGVSSIEAASFVSPKAVPQLADAEALFPRLPNGRDTAYMVLIPNHKGYERARAVGAQSVALVLATTDTFNHNLLGLSLDDAIELCAGVIRRAKDDGVRARAYLSGAFVCPYEGPISPDVVFDLSARMIDAGADEVAISDTIGAGNPAQAAHLFSTLAHKYGAERLAGHFHDTRGMGLVLTWAALEAGVRTFDSSIGGLGGCPFAPGASGNLATEDLVFMLNESGFTTGIDIDALHLAIGVAEDITGTRLGGRTAAWFQSQENQRAAAG